MSPRQSVGLTGGQNEVYPVCELDSQRGGQRLKNEVYPVRRLTDVPLGTAAKRGLPGSWPPLTARVASRAVEGCALKPICLVAWSQNEVYSVRRLTDVPLGNSRKSEVCPVLGRF
jgi:hypothetical protein